MKELEVTQSTLDRKERQLKKVQLMYSNAVREKQKLAKERDRLEQELEKQKYLARELQDQVSIPV